MLYNIFKKTKKSILVVNIGYFYHGKLLPYLKGKRPVKFSENDILEYIACTFPIKNIRNFTNKKIKNIKMAIVSDNMTYEDFKNECKLSYLKPYNWLYKIKNFKPDIFFCESAWRGIDNEWRGKIYRNNKLLFENRNELLDIIDFCKKVKIPTVFWNKEDPTYFGNQEYDFVSTALKFDYIFTTSKECIQKYKALGHQNVYDLTFGFSPQIYNPIGKKRQNNKVIFAGSWYNDLKKRCKDMEDIFDFVIKEGYDLEIYDRNYYLKNTNNKYPKKYNKYIRPSVSSKELGNILKKSEIAININTVTNSESMFARRVYELMATGNIILSNESKALRRAYGTNIWFYGEEFNFASKNKIIKENIKHVFKHHKTSDRLEKVFRKIGLIERRRRMDENK